jgi:orotate phosphoribosyltransferase
LISRPAAWRVVIEAFKAKLPEADDRVIAGVESAGIPHSSALAFATQRASVFVRKEAKGHGLGRRIEGGDVAGRTVVLVEDMVTTGGSSLSAVAALRESGAEVTECLAIITYGFIEATDAFDAANCRLTTLTTFETVVREALASGAIDARTADLVRGWLSDPHGWDPS